MLAHKYKPTVQKDIDGMLVAGIIYPVKKSEWASPMVIQSAKHNPKSLRICVDFRGLNILMVIDPFPTPSAHEIIDEVMGMNDILLLVDFQGTIKYRSLWKINKKPHSYLNLAHFHTM